MKMKCRLKAGALILAMGLGCFGVSTPAMAEEETPVVDEEIPLSQEG